MVPALPYSTHLWQVIRYFSRGCFLIQSRTRDGPVSAYLVDWLDDFIGLVYFTSHFNICSAFLGTSTE